LFRPDKTKVVETTLLKPNKSLVNKIVIALIFIVAIKLGGFFTVSDSVAITRVVKIVVRFSMTAGLLIIYNRLISSQHIASFRTQHSLALIFYLLYLSLGMVSLFWSTKISYSAIQLLMDIELLVFSYYFIKLILLIQHYHPDSKLRISLIFSNAIFLVVSAMIIGRFVNPDKFFRLTHGGEVARLGGFLMNPNELGMLAVIGITMCFIELRKYSSSLWTLIMLALMLYTLYLTGSRSSMIGFALITVYFVSKSNSRLLKATSVIVAVLIIPVIFKTIFLKAGDLEEVLSMTGRIPFWKALLTEALPQEPLFGFGFMRIYYTDYFESVHTYAAKMTHNTFIQVLLNLGFVGFTIVVLQMTFTFQAFKRTVSKEKKAIFIGVMIPILINSFTEFGIFGETNFGILFYQILIFSLVLRFNPEFTQIERLKLRKAGRVSQIETKVSF
jgi:hypothetical protein